MFWYGEKQIKKKYILIHKLIEKLCFLRTSKSIPSGAANECNINQNRTCIMRYNKQNAFSVLTLVFKIKKKSIHGVLEVVHPSNVANKTADAYFGPCCMGSFCENS